MQATPFFRTPTPAHRGGVVLPTSIKSVICRQKGNSPLENVVNSVRIGSVRRAVFNLTIGFVAAAYAHGQFVTGEKGLVLCPSDDCRTEVKASYKSCPKCNREYSPCLICLNPCIERKPLCRSCLDRQEIPVSPLLITDGSYCSVAWGPNGRIYILKRLADKGCLYSCNPDGSDVVNVMPSGPDFYTLSASHTGLTALASDQTLQLKIFTLSSETFELRSVPEGRAINSHLSLGPGNEVLISLEDIGSANLYALSVSGFALRRVTSLDGNERSAAWRSDGKIAFSYEFGDERAIMTMDSNGKNLRTVLRGTFHFGHIAWTNDGRLVFAAGLTGAFKLYAVNEDGQNLFPLVRLSDYPGTHSVNSSGKVIFWSSGRQGTGVYQFQLPPKVESR